MTKTTLTINGKLFEVVHLELEAKIEEFNEAMIGLSRSMEAIFPLNIYANFKLSSDLRVRALALKRMLKPHTHRRSKLLARIVRTAP